MASEFSKSYFSSNVSFQKKKCPISGKKSWCFGFGSMFQVILVAFFSHAQLDHKVWI